VQHHASDATTQSTVVFEPGDRVRIHSRIPAAPHRTPFYLLGKRGTVKSVLVPAAIDAGDDDAGGLPASQFHYYRVVIPMTEIWPARRTTACVSSSSKHGCREPEHSPLPRPAKGVQK